MWGILNSIIILVRLVSSLDRNLGDTILHVAGYLSKEAVCRALGFSMKSAVVDLETCNAEGEECDHSAWRSARWLRWVWILF